MYVAITVTVDMGPCSFSPMQQSPFRTSLTAFSRTAPPKISAPPKPSLKPRSKAPFVFVGIAAYSLTAYGAYVYFSLKNIPQQDHHQSEQIDKSHVYENIARKYDNEIWASEFFMGMPLLRRSLGKRAEVSRTVGWLVRHKLE